MGIAAAVMLIEEIILYFVTLDGAAASLRTVIAVPLVYAVIRIITPASPKHGVLLPLFVIGGMVLIEVLYQYLMADTLGGREEWAQAAMNYTLRWELVLLPVGSIPTFVAEMFLLKNGGDSNE